MSAARASVYWLVGLIVAVTLVYLLRSILLPFIVGIATAYFLDPAADWLEAKGASRTLATSIITAIFLLIVAGLLLVLVPMITAQVQELLRDLPRYAESVQKLATWLAGALEDRLSAQEMAALKKSASQISGQAAKWIGAGLGGLVRGGFALFQIVSLIFITPVVTFYLLRDWDRIVDTASDWIPPRHRKEARTLGANLDRRLAGFLRGQAMVCLALAAFYAVALSLAGLKLGLIVGIAAGALTFIPFVGALLGFVASVGLALVQFDTLLPVLVIAAIFMAGQVIESAFLQPKLVGDRVDLNPVWIIFAVFAGGALFGFLGVLLAVPIAIVVSEFARHGLIVYRASPLFAAPAAPKTPGTARRGRKK